MLEEPSFKCAVKHTKIDIRGYRLTAPAKVHARLVLASVDDARRVRLWDVDELVASYDADVRLSPVLLGMDTLGALAVDASSGAVLVGTRMGKISALDAATGAARGERSSGLQNAAGAIADVGAGVSWCSPARTAHCACSTSRTARRPDPR